MTEKTQTSNTLTLQAPAKINLALDVLGLREDGYHLLKMIMQSVDLQDTVTLTLRKDDEITFTCDVAGLSDSKHNLCVKAARLLVAEGLLKSGLSIDLKKRIPSEAGMAGGSSDAAAVLCGLNELCGLGLSYEQLESLGVRLGADVPFCIRGGTQVAEGIGEILTELPAWEGLPVLIAKPAAGASTKDIFAKIDAVSELPHPEVEGVLRAVETKDPALLTRTMGNVLELATLPLVPEIAQIKEWMTAHGALGALMSGSGSAVFGIYETLLQAKEAATVLSEEMPQLFIYAGSTCGPRGAF